MHSYYAEKLAADRLKLCYDLAPPSVKRYLAAEIDHVSDKAASAERVLELGCGYGRVLREISHTNGEFFGIDTSLASLSMALSYFEKRKTATLLKMDAVQLGFQSGTFDLVYCIQNGISAFHVDQQKLLSEAVRVTKSGGRVLFSSYAGSFWNERLFWFRIQSNYGLVGEIDAQATGDGVIVTKDGFTATTVTPEEFMNLTRNLGFSQKITVVEGSSVFCEILV